MNNPLKSQIAANRERFDEQFINLVTIVIPVKPRGEENGSHKLVERTPEVKSFLTTSQTSLLQTAIAAVEGIKKKTPMQEGKWMPIDDRNDGFNSALSKVVELLKGGIE